MKKFLTIVICISICLLVAFLSSLLQYDALTNWYPYLMKSPINPPGYVFGIAWTILFILMGMSIALILNTAKTNKRLKTTSVFLFIMQLIVNYMWSFTFFYSRSILWGAVVIVLLIIVCLLYMTFAKRISKLASWLFIPYILWLVFALYLNIFICFYN